MEGKSAPSFDSVGPIHRKALAISFLFCSHEGMERDSLSAIILNSPAWARVGLTMPDERMRERAADALAASIIEKLNPPQEPDRNQLPLPL